MSMILKPSRSRMRMIVVLTGRIAGRVMWTKERKRRRAGLSAVENDLSLTELCDRAEIAPELAKELEDYGLLAPRVEDGDKRYREGDADIAAACGNLSRYGIAPRHLRAFRTSADREAGLLEALVAPALRSRNQERRQSGLEDLQNLAELAQELSQLLFWRDLRELASS